MAMINGRRVQQQQLAMAGAGAIADTLVANRQLVASIARRVGDYMRSNPGSKTAPKRKKANKAGNGKSPSNGGAASMKISRSLGAGGTGKLRVVDRYMEGQTNNPANQVANYYLVSLAGATGSSGTPLLAAFTKLNAFKNLYRHYRVLYFKVTWVPCLSDNASGGTVFWRWDSTPDNYANNTTPTQYLAAQDHLITPVTKGASYTWRPKEQKEREEKYTVAGTKDADELHCAVNQYYIPNTQPISTLVGYFAFEAEVEFSNPNA